MKRLITCCAAALVCIICLAQNDFKERYERQVKNVGFSGVGVETILDRWQEAEPDNVDMLEGRINFYYSKGQRTDLVVKESARYMGNKPAITLKDSLGLPVNYFQEIIFDDEQFALCQKEIDKAIALHPRELMFREDKITTLCSYEKESPDLAVSELSSLIAAYKSSADSWTYQGAALTPEMFKGVVQNFCFAFYRIGSPRSYECFKQISEIMAKADPKDPDFQNNLGSYYLVAAKNPKQALKYYNKVLKADPENETALANKKIADRQIALSKKK